MLACRGYVTVSRCAHEYQLPALFQLWPGKGTASQVQLAAELTELLVQAFPGREVHGAGDAALHGEAPGHQGHDLNHEAAGPARSSPGRTPPADRAARSAAGDRGADRQVQGRRRRGLARGDRPDLRQAAEGAGRRVPGTVARQLQGRSGRLVLMREPDSGNLMTWVSSPSIPGCRRRRSSGTPGGGRLNPPTPPASRSPPPTCTPPSARCSPAPE